MPLRPGGDKVSKVLVVTNDGVCTITLADTVNRNVLGVELLADLQATLDAAAADAAVRAVVVTNLGSVFCAGADLKATPDAAAAERFAALLKQIQTSPKPIIGRICGDAFGGGVGLAAAFDISLASDAATFGFSEVRLGVVPAVISVVCLHKMRRSDAMESYLRGNRFPASHAAHIGLITRAVPVALLDQALAETLADIRLGGPGALAVAKRLINEVPGMPVDAAYAWAAALSVSVFAGEEARAGTDAFRARRRPPWAP